MHVIITGGSSGIGLAVAKLYASKGARLSLIARDEERLNAARTEIAFSAGSGDVHCEPADTTSNAAIADAVVACETANGPCDILIASAGIVEPGAFETVQSELFDRQIAVNLIGTANAIRAVYTGMRERGGGTIMVVSSGAALVGIHGYAAYCASKSALDGLVEALRAEMSGTGVHISICYPPDTLTPQYEREIGVRPWQAALLMGQVKPWPADAVALRIVTAVERGQGRLYFTPSLAALAAFGLLAKAGLGLWYQWRLRREQAARCGMSGGRSRTRRPSPANTVRRQ